MWCPPPHPPHIWKWICAPGYQGRPSMFRIERGWGDKSEKLSEIFGVFLGAPNCNTEFFSRKARINIDKFVCFLNHIFAIMNFSSCLNYWGWGGGNRYVCPQYFHWRGDRPPPSNNAFACYKFILQILDLQKCSNLVDGAVFNNCWLPIT